jgi:hypothetical protein
MSDEQAVETLRSRQATFYDPVVVEKFIELIPELRRGDASATASAKTDVSLVGGLARSTPRSGRDGDARALPLSSAQRNFIDEQVARMRGADACLFELNGVQDAVVVAHATPRIRRAVADLQTPMGAGISGWVAANRSTIRRAEPGLDIGELASAYMLNTCAGVPVFVRADLFGVLTVYFKDTTLSDEAVASVGLLAQEVGLSIARDGVLVAERPVRTEARLSVAAAS